MINNTDVKVSYAGDGTTKVFPFSFPFIQKSYIKVAIYDSLTQETVTLTSDYYVDENARTVTYPGYAPGQAPAEALQPPILPATSIITIYRETEITQLTDLGDKYPLPDIENMSDKLTEIMQEHDEGLSRAIKVPIGDPETPEEKYLNMQTYIAETAANAAAAADSAADAEGSALAAGHSAVEAAGYAEEATNSATAAANSATAAASSAADADSAATRAAASQVSTISNLVDRAENAVAAINAYAAPAWNNTVVYSYPDVVTYTDGMTYRCLGENVTAGTIPPSSPLWMRITTRGGDDFWDIDVWGGYMPSENPTASYSWELDSNGDVMPRNAIDNTGREAKTVAEEALEAANAATAAANDATDAANALIAATPMELDADGNVTPVEIPAENDEEEEP